MIHLGYAYELSSPTIAIEALALTATCYSDFHKYIDDPSYTRPSDKPTTSLTEILNRVHHDSRFDNVSPTRELINTEELLRRHEAAIIEYWNSWSVTDPVIQFRESQRAAVLLFIATVPPGSDGYDFFLVHLLTSSHAVRILLPLIPAEYHIPLVRQWWLFVLMTYIGQSRPRIEAERIVDYDLQGKDWKWVDYMALHSDYSTDEHYVKGI